MKYVKFVLLVAITAVLVGMYGCTTQKDPDTTENSEVKAIESTTVLKEETEVIETTETTEKAAFDSEKFELFDDYIYRYTGGDGSVTFEDYGLTVQLPEAWIGRVGIFCGDTSAMHIFLANIELMDAYAEYLERPTESTHAWHDYMLHVFSVRKDSETHIEEDEHATFLGENEKYRFYYTTASNMNTDCNTFLTIRHSLIQDKGQEYYDSLVGDLICTDEMVKEIIKVSEIS